MRVLLDHCVDVRFKHLLPGHDVHGTKELEWEELSNGMLLAAAEGGGFQVLITVDKNLRNQQNLTKRKLAVITLASRFTALEDIEPLAPKVMRVLEGEMELGTDIVITSESA